MSEEDLDILEGEVGRIEGLDLLRGKVGCCMWW